MKLCIFAWSIATTGIWKSYPRVTVTVGRGPSRCAVRHLAQDCWRFAEAVCIAFLAACCFGLTATAQNPSSYVPTKGEIVFSLYQSSEGKPIHTRPSNPFTSHRRANQFYIDLDNAQVMQTYPYAKIQRTGFPQSRWQPCHRYRRRTLQVAPPGQCQVS